MNPLPSKLVSVGLALLTGCAPGLDPELEESLEDGDSLEEPRSAPLPPLLLGSTNVTDTYYGVAGRVQ